MRRGDAIFAVNFTNIDSCTAAAPINRVKHDDVAKSAAGGGGGRASRAEIVSHFH